MLDSVKHWLDWLSGLTVASAIVGILPPLVAIFGLVWYCIQIYESQTFQAYTSKRREAKMMRLRAILANLEIKNELAYKVARVSHAATKAAEKVESARLEAASLLKEAEKPPAPPAPPAEPKRSK